ncbi:MAG: hypothetical protein BWY45_02770 [Euryarchaeota archaeon ADurb.Bin294]|nr:MAG: hypothetical protein BWY45_02770 [Euryarchaeota archaeon ADurb.Bin294]
MSEDLKALKESKKKDKPKEETGEKKKRLPAFRKQEDGTVLHRTKEGQHGPGAYRIESKEGEHHLTFEDKNGFVQSLGRHGDIKELKRMVAGFKEGEKNEAPKEEHVGKPGKRPKKPMSFDDHPGDITSDWINVKFAHLREPFKPEDWSKIQDWMRGINDDMHEYNATGKSIDYETHRKKFRDILSGINHSQIKLRESESKPESKPLSEKSSEKRGEKKEPVKISSDKISYEKELPDGYGKIISRMVSTTGEDLFTEIITPSGKSFFKVNPSTTWMNVWVQPNGKKMSAWEGVTPEIAQGRITDAVTAMKKLEKKGSSSVEEHRGRIIQLVSMGRIAAVSKTTQSHLDIHGIKPPADISSVRTENYPDEVYTYSQLPKWTQNDDGSWEVPIVQQMKVLKTAPGKYDGPFDAHRFDTVYTSGKLGSYVVRNSGLKTQTLYYKSPAGIETPMDSHMRGNNQNFYEHYGERSTTQEEIDTYTKNYAEKQQAKEARKQAAAKTKAPRKVKDKSHLTLFKTVPEGIRYIKENCKTPVNNIEGMSINGIHVLAVWLTKVESELGGPLPLAEISPGTVTNKRALAQYSARLNKINLRKGDKFWMDDNIMIKANELSAERNADGVPWSPYPTATGTLWHELGHCIDDKIANRELTEKTDIWFNNASSEAKAEAYKLSQYSQFTNYMSFHGAHSEYVAESVCAIMTRSDRVKYIPKPIHDRIVDTLATMNLHPENFSIGGV